MTTLLAPAGPAIGARYRHHCTGRTWHVLKICNSGLISLGEEYYGTDCERRVYLTDDELRGGYDPLS